MIVKTVSRKARPAGLLRYLFKEEEKLLNQEGKAFLIRHNLKSRSLEKYILEFEENESFRLRKRKDNVLLYHTVLSFSDKDKSHINDEILKAIAKQYVSLRGKDSMYLGAAHYDKDHIHLHIIMSGTKYLTGEANRISKKEFQDIKIGLDAFQKEHFPELSHSLPKHGQKEFVKNTERTISWSGKMSDKGLVLQAIEKAYKDSQSLKDFLDRLHNEDHAPYYRGGNLTGIQLSSGRKFRFNRLGYDKEKLNMLEARKQKELVSLNELKTLRERSGREKEKIDKEESGIFRRSENELSPER